MENELNLDLQIIPILLLQQYEKQVDKNLFAQFDQLRDA